MNKEIVVIDKVNISDIKGDFSTPNAMHYPRTDDVYIVDINDVLSSLLIGDAKYIALWELYYCPVVKETNDNSWESIPDDYNYDSFKAMPREIGEYIYGKEGDKPERRIQRRPR